MHLPPTPPDELDAGRRWLGRILQALFVVALLFLAGVFHAHVLGAGPLLPWWGYPLLGLASLAGEALWSGWREPPPPLDASLERLRRLHR